ncbi:unnamed protein product, partial [Scytosiphon promiscuus]
TTTRQEREHSLADQQGTRLRGRGLLDQRIGDRAMEYTRTKEQAAEQTPTQLAAASGGAGSTHEAPPAPRSPSRRKISEDLENTPSPHKAGVQRHIAMPKPMKL